VKAADQRKLERRLRGAQADARLVRVERSDIEDGHMDGRVLGVGPRAIASKAQVSKPRMRRQKFVSQPQRRRLV
jgi:hypothetical protein